MFFSVESTSLVRLRILQKDEKDLDLKVQGELS